MQTAHVLTIDGIKIISGVRDGVIDPVASAREQKDIYFPPSGEDFEVTPEQAQEIEESLRNGVKFDVSFNPVIDLKGSYYGIVDPETGCWVQRTVDKLGESIPEGATPGMLTDIQHKHNALKAFEAKTEEDKVSFLTHLKNSKKSSLVRAAFEKQFDDGDFDAKTFVATEMDVFKQWLVSNYGRSE